MQENPKREHPQPEEQNEKRRSYYYDDAHGYEIYEPDAEGDEENDKNDRADPD